MNYPMKKYLLSAVVVFGFLFYTFSSNSNKKISISLVSPDLTVKPTDSNKITFEPSPTEPPMPTSPPPTQVPTRVAPTSTPIPSGKYKNGTYTGDSINFVYGDMQVQAIVENGKLVKVNTLKYPNDRETSVEINSEALPRLQREAIAVQSAQVDIVSGATDSSQAFMESLATALAKAN